jgi:hypothetical protein
MVAVSNHTRKRVQRVQTGVRIEKRVLKILKSVSAFHEVSLSDLLEGMILHNFEGTAPFGEETLALIAILRKTYGLDVMAVDSHRLIEDQDVLSD